MVIRYRLGKQYTIFEVVPLMHQLLNAGYPVMRRRLPTDWDREQYELFIKQQLHDLEV